MKSNKILFALAVACGLGAAPLVSAELGEEDAALSGEEQVYLEPEQQAKGNIEAVDPEANTFTLDPGLFARSDEFEVNDETRIQLGEREIELRELQEGDPVTVFYTQDGDQKISKRVEVNRDDAAKEDQDTEVSPRASVQESEEPQALNY